MRIEIAPTIVDALDEVTHKYCSTHVSVISRLLVWVADQDEETQAVILRLVTGETKMTYGSRVLQRTLRKKHVA
jgi:hypothetical protein